MELQDVKKDLSKIFNDGTSESRAKIEEILRFLEEQRDLLKDLLVGLGQGEMAFGQTQAQLICTLDEVTGLKIQTEEYLWNPEPSVVPVNHPVKMDTIKFGDHTDKPAVVITVFEGFFIEAFIKLRSVGICKMEIVGIDERKFSYAADYIHDFDPKSPLFEEFLKSYSKACRPVEMIYLYAWNLSQPFLTIKNGPEKPPYYLEQYYDLYSLPIKI